MDGQALSVHLRQPAVRIGHADSAFFLRGEVQDSLHDFLVHSDTVVLHFKPGSVFLPHNSYPQGSALDLAQKAVVDGVFDQRLDGERRDEHVFAARADLPLDGQALAEPFLFDVQVRLDQFQLVGERHPFACVQEVEADPQKRSKRVSEIAHLFCIDVTQSQDGAECVKQKMRVDFAPANMLPPCAPFIRLRKPIPRKIGDKRPKSDPRCKGQL